MPYIFTYKKYFCFIERATFREPKVRGKLAFYMEFGTPLTTKTKRNKMHRWSGCLVRRLVRGITPTWKGRSLHITFRRCGFVLLDCTAEAVVATRHIGSIGRIAKGAIIERERAFGELTRRSRAAISWAASAASVAPRTRCTV